MTMFERPGLATHFVLEGEGEPLVCIHGVGACIENWDGVAPRLSQRFRVLRYDLRGHGRSTRVTGPYSLPMLADDLAALLDHLGFDSVHVAGHSLGGMIAQTFALRYPARVRRLVLLSAVAGRTAEERKAVASRIDLIRTGDAGDHFRRSVARWFTDEFIAANPGLIAAYATRNAANDPDCYAAAYRVLALEDLDRELEAIAAPTLIATGENDLGSNPRMSRLMHERIKASLLRILPRLKHSILVEAPDLVAGLMIAFLQGTAVPESDPTARNAADRANQE